MTCNIQLKTPGVINYNEESHYGLDVDACQHPDRKLYENSPSA